MRVSGRLARLTKRSRRRERERKGRLLRLIDSFFSTLQRGESLTTWITCLLRQSGAGAVRTCWHLPQWTWPITPSPPPPPPPPAQSPGQSSKSADIMKSNFCFTFSPCCRHRPVATVAGVTRFFHPGVTFNFTPSCVTSRRPAPPRPTAAAYGSTNLLWKTVCRTGVLRGVPRRRAKRFSKVTRAK